MRVSSGKSMASCHTIQWWASLTMQMCSISISCQRCRKKLCMFYLPQILKLFYGKESYWFPFLCPKNNSCMVFSWSIVSCVRMWQVVLRLVPHVDKPPLPLRILRLVTSNFLQVENPTHPTAHASERSSVYILGQFRTSKWEMNMYWKLRRFAVLSFRYKVFQILLLLVISILIIFSMSLDFDVIVLRYLPK